MTLPCGGFSSASCACPDMQELIPQRVLHMRTRLGKAVTCYQREFQGGSDGGDHRPSPVPARSCGAQPSSAAARPPGQEGTRRLSIVEKSKDEDYFVTCENRTKFQFQSPEPRPHPFLSVLSVAVCGLSHRSARPPKPEFCTVWPFTETTGDPGHRASVLFTDSVQKLSHVRYFTYLNMVLPKYESYSSL